MKYKKILLILAIATLSLTACKKEENSTPETTAVEEITITEELTNIAEPETQVNLEDNSVEELTGVDSTGSDITLEEGDYIEPSEPEVPLEKPADYVEEERTTDDVLADLKDYYEQGIFTKEQYESLVQAATGGSSSSGSSYSQQNTLTAEQQAAVDAMRTDTLPPTDNRTNIDYDGPRDQSLSGYRIN